MSDFKRRNSGRPVEIDAGTKAIVRAYYEAGAMTYKELRKEYGVSEATISHWVKKEGWKRNLDSPVIIAEKRDKQLEVIRQNALVEAERTAIEDAAARTQAEVITAHKRQIDRYVKSCDQLLSEFEAQVMTPEQMRAIAELNCKVRNVEATPEEIDKAVQSVKKLLSLGERAETLTKLVAAKSKLVDMERKTCGIKEDDARPREPISIVLKMGGDTEPTTLAITNQNFNKAHDSD